MKSIPAHPGYHASLQNRQIHPGTAQWIPIKPRRPLTRDQVHFGKLPHITGPIPPNSLIILVPGMFSPASCISPLAEHLRKNHHSVHLLTSPFNVRAGSTLASTDWLTHEIDRVRLDEASTRYLILKEKMKEVPSEERTTVVRKHLGLKDNALGNATAQAALGLMFTAESNFQEETDFSRIIQRQRQIREALGGTYPAENARKQLYSLTEIARNQLHDELVEIFLHPPADARQPFNVKTQDKTLQKTIDHVMDQIAPRVVLVGHSMGGFVSMLTLFEQMKDTAMVVGLAAPGENGTEFIPSGLSALTVFPLTIQQQGRRILESIGPGLRHMLHGSPETNKLKAKHQPFNTTIFAVGMPGNADGLVGEPNFRMNDQLPGRINVIVTPRKANVIELFSTRLHQMHEWMRMLPLVARVEDYWINSMAFVQGISHHVGVVQYQEKYWAQNGDMLRGLLEAPKNEHGQYDYQHGTPDYPEAIQQMKRMLSPFNYETGRVHFLNILQDTLTDAQAERSAPDYQELLNAYTPLCPTLENLVNEPQPIENGVSDKASKLLQILEMV